MLPWWIFRWIPSDFEHWTNDNIKLNIWDERKLKGFEHEHSFIYLPRKNALTNGIWSSLDSIKRSKYSKTVHTYCAGVGKKIGFSVLGMYNFSTALELPSVQSILSSSASFSLITFNFRKLKFRLTRISSSLFKLEWICPEVIWRSCSRNCARVKMIDLD